MSNINDIKYVSESWELLTTKQLQDYYALRLDDYNKDELIKQLCLVVESDRDIKELENLVKLMIDSTFFE